MTKKQKHPKQRLVPKPASLYRFRTKNDINRLEVIDRTIKAIKVIPELKDGGRYLKLFIYDR